LIQLTRKGVINKGKEQELDLLREKYARDNYVILPQLYEPTLLEDIMQRVEAAKFLPRNHEDIARELCMADHATTAMLTFFPNNPVFLRLIEQITGQPRMGLFSGRVYRMTFADGHHQDWHNDTYDRRVATMSVNLSRQVFEGGALQIKRRDSNEILQHIRNIGFGDALLFRVSSDLMHRVEGVRGDISKTAFVGWFLDVEDVLPNFRNSPGPSSRTRANDEPDWEVPVCDKFP
jgi:hypothetical protein